MKKVLLVTLVLCAAVLWGGNSIFSYYGFPVRNYGLDIYSLGMGDTGASDIYRYNTGYANPAMHNRSNRTLFSTGMVMGYTNYESESNGVKKSYRDDAMDFPYFNVSIPAGKHRWGAQFNSHSSGLVSNQITLADGSIETQTADKYLYRADLIYSYNLGSINAGISGNYYFGHDKRYFSQDGGNNFNTNESLIRDFKSPSLTAGILKSFDKLCLGAHYSLPVTMKGESVRHSIHDTEEAVDYEYKMPEQYNLSVTVLPAKQIKVAVDATYEPWGNVSESYRDCLRAGIGLAYEPDPELHKNVFMKLPMRVGASFRQLEFPDKDGNDIDELALSYGLTFPLKMDVNRIDIGLQFLKRGNLDTNQLSDTSLMFMLGFTGFDIISKAGNRTAPRDIPVKEVSE